MKRPSRYLVFTNRCQTTFFFFATVGPFETELFLSSALWNGSFYFFFPRHYVSACFGAAICCGGWLRSLSRCSFVSPTGKRKISRCPRGCRNFELNFQVRFDEVVRILWCDRSCFLNIVYWNRKRKNCLIWWDTANEEDFHYSKNDSSRLCFDQFTEFNRIYFSSFKYKFSYENVLRTR